MSLSVQVAGKSDVGCVRTNNEDNFGYDTRQGIFVVCDGMGGQAAGEVAGMITREEAEKSEMQNIIIRALGPEEKVEPDLDDMMAQEGDLLLMATDGLTKLVNDEKLRDTLMAAPSLERACDELITAAKDAGGEDNVTCVLLRIQRRPWYKQLFNWFASGGGEDQWQNSF